MLALDSHLADATRLVTSKDFDAALRSLNKAESAFAQLDKEQQNKETGLLLRMREKKMDCLINTEEYDEAANTGIALCKQFPSHTVGFRCMAGLLRRVQQLDAATKYAQRAVDLGGGLPAQILLKSIDTDKNIVRSSRNKDSSRSGSNMNLAATLTVEIPDPSVFPVTTAATPSPQRAGSAGTGTAASSPVPPLSLNRTGGADSPGESDAAAATPQAQRYNHQKHATIAESSSPQTLEKKLSNATTAGIPHSILIPLVTLGFLMLLGPFFLNKVMLVVLTAAGVWMIHNMEERVAKRKEVLFLRVGGIPLSVLTSAALSYVLWV